MREILAIDPLWLDHRREAVAAWLRSGRTFEAGPEAAAKLVPVRRGVGSVAVIPVVGFLTQHPSLLSMLFGGTSTEAVAVEVAAAARDSSVSAIVLDVDSPGGSVFGVSEAAAKIRSARGQKPVFAVADAVAASAAYWLASQADEVIGTPSSLTGSIGVIGAYLDTSEAQAREGVKMTVFRYGENKIGDTGEPLSEEGIREIQAQVDYFGRLFDADVAKGRRVSVERVRADFGQGATFTADTAQRAGLIDRVETLDEVVRQAVAGRRPASMGPAPRGYDPVELAARASLGGLDSLR